MEAAYDGKIGYDLFCRHSFDLVILDINLPGMSGYELCRAIRGKNIQIPVIMLTALGGLTNKFRHAA